jgi:hypothetical protein
MVGELAQFPAKAAPLFRPVAYKVMHGGRGGAKSWAAARALLLLGSQKKLFILSAREIQTRALPVRSIERAGRWDRAHKHHCLLALLFVPN